MSFLSTVLKSRSGVAPAPAPPVALSSGTPFAVASIRDAKSVLSVAVTRIGVRRDGVMKLVFEFHPTQAISTDRVTIRIGGEPRTMTLRCGSVSVASGDTLTIGYEMGL